MAKTLEDVKEYFRELTEDPNVFDEGRRNDDAVNLCCFCQCLGLDPLEEFDKLSVKYMWDKRQYAKALDHVKRVIPYLDKWGERGTLQALTYAIDY